MSERLSVEQVRHVANLARMAITPPEEQRLSEQLSVIAGHFQDIEALDLDGVPATTHALPITNVFRADEIRPSLEREALLSQAPAAEDGRFRVPRILGEQP